MSYGDQDQALNRVREEMSRLLIAAQADYDTKFRHLEDRSKAEIAGVRAEIAHLRAERADLRAERADLPAERADLRASLDQLSRRVSLMGTPVRVSCCRAAMAVLYQKARLAMMSQEDAAEVRRANAAPGADVDWPFTAPLIEWPATKKALFAKAMGEFESLTVRRNEEPHTVSVPLLKEALEMGPVANIVSVEVIELLKLLFADLFEKEHDEVSQEGPRHADVGTLV